MHMGDVIIVVFFFLHACIEYFSSLAVNMHRNSLRALYYWQATHLKSSLIILFRCWSVGLLPLATYNHTLSSHPQIYIEIPRGVRAGGEGERQSATKPRKGRRRGEEGGEEEEDGEHQTPLPSFPSLLSPPVHFARSTDRSGPPRGARATSRTSSSCPPASPPPR